MEPRFRLLTTTQIARVYHCFIYTRAPLQPELLDSATQAPLWILYYKSSDQQNVFYLAARLVENMMMIHPFWDGNKRTGLWAAGIFLKLNGWSLTRSTHGIDVTGAGNLMLEDAVVAGVTKELTVEQLGTYLRKKSEKVDELGLE